MTTAQVRSEWRELGQRLRDARRQRNLTQEQVAEQIDLTRTTVTNIETGKHNPLLHLPELSALYAMPMQELVGEPQFSLSGLRKRLLNEDEDKFLRAYRRRDLATLHRLIEAWWEGKQP